MLLEAEARRAEADGAGVRLTVRTPGGERMLEGSHVLRAAGRVPNTDRLDLAAAGIATDGKGFITVNDRLETSVPGVYALGDVKGGPAFTHISYDDFRVIRTNLLQGGRACITDRLRTVHRIHRPAAGPDRTEREGRPPAGRGRTGWRGCP